MDKIRLHQTRKRPLRVLTLFSPAYENLRQKVIGIVRYSQHYGPWEFNVTPRGLNDSYIPDFKKWHPDGILGQNMTSSVVDTIIRSEIPCVIFEPTFEFRQREHPFYQYPTVRIDSESIGRMAARYFIERNFIHFAYVCEYKSIFWSEVRKTAFAEEVQRHGFNCEFYPFQSLEDNRDMVTQDKKMARWLKLLPKPIGILASNDHQGRRILNCCLSEGIAVPYQISVLGVDNDEFYCLTTNPPLSSIGTEAQWGGYQGAKLLDLLLRGESTAPHEILYGPTEIVSRESTSVMNTDDSLVIRGIEFIRLNSGCRIRVSDVVEHLGISWRLAEYRFQKALGRSVMDEIKRIRMETIMKLVLETDTPVQEIANRAGFESSIHLCAIIKKEYGQTISQIRREGRQKNHTHFQ